MKNDRRMRGSRNGEHATTVGFIMKYMILLGFEQIYKSMQNTSNKCPPKRPTSIKTMYRIHVPNKYQKQTGQCREWEPERAPETEKTLIKNIPETGRNN